MVMLEQWADVLCTNGTRMQSHSPNGQLSSTTRAMLNGMFRHVISRVADGQVGDQDVGCRSALLQLVYYTTDQEVAGQRYDHNKRVGQNERNVALSGLALHRLQQFVQLVTVARVVQYIVEVGIVQVVTGIIIFHCELSSDQQVQQYLQVTQSASIITITVL